MTERRPFWLNLGKHRVSRMVCTSVQACLKFSHSLSRTIVPRGIGAAAAAAAAAAGRRFKQSPKGKRGGRKKKGGKGQG